MLQSFSGIKWRQKQFSLKATGASIQSISKGCFLLSWSAHSSQPLTIKKSERQVKNEWDWGQNEWDYKFYIKVWPTLVFVTYFSLWWPQEVSSDRLCSERSMGYPWLMWCKAISSVTRWRNHLVKYLHYSHARRIIFCWTVAHAYVHNILHACSLKAHECKFLIRLTIVFP